jgi:diguanylate cyclase (GGDEF)-like protein/PAS domain S-box-containing protein
MSSVPPQFTDRAGEVLSDAQMRRTVWVVVYLTLLLPAFVGGSLMGVAGYYPLPEFYLIFGSYTGAYVLAMLGVGGVFARWLAAHVLALGRLESEQAQPQLRRFFRRLPLWGLGILTAYSMLGALSADLSLASLGYRHYDLRGHLNNQFGAVLAVLVSAFPIYFHFTDQLGRYFGPRGVHGVVVPMVIKLAVLGIVTPLLIDSLLVGYFVNQNGHLPPRLLLMWLGLLALAAGSTWLALRSLRQGLAPLQRLLKDEAGVLDEASIARLKPLSIDEFGALTHRMARQLTQLHELANDLRRAQALSQAMLQHANTVVLVLDREGRLVRFNQAAERLSGYRAAEVMGRFVWDLLIPPEQAEAVRQNAFEALIHHPETLSGRYTNEWVSRDGSRHLIDWFNAVVHDAQGAMEFVVSVGVDITERQRMEETLRRSEATYARAEAIAHIGSWHWDIAGGSLHWSDEIYRIFGLDPQSFGSTYDAFLQAIHPEDRQIVVDAVNASLADAKRPYDVVHRVVRPDGGVRTVHEYGEIYRDQSGKPLRMIGTVQDVTEVVRRDEALRESERKYRRLHESMTDAYGMVDMQGRLLEWNPAFQALLGYSAEELAQMSYQALTPPRWHEQEERIVREQVLPRGYSDVYEKEYLCRNGRVLPVELRTYLLRDDSGRPTGMWAMVRDISERKVTEARIANLAYFDPLTGLPNRVLFTDRLQAALARARRDNERLAVLFVDLDKFKPVNDTYGHAVGDQLLLVIARHLRACVREADTVARIGGDEFVVLLTEVRGADDALAVAGKIHHTLRQPITVGAYQLEVSSSIGVAIFPEHGHDDVQLIKSADDAMYRAKDAGRDRVLLAS